MKIIKFIKKRYKRIIVSVVSLISCFIIFTVSAFAVPAPKPYEVTVTNLSVNNNQVFTSTFTDRNGGLAHPQLNGVLNFIEDATCSFNVENRPDSLQGGKYNISLNFVLFYAGYHDKNYFENSKVVFESSSGWSFSENIVKYDSVINASFSHPSGNDTKYDFKINFDFEYIYDNLDGFNYFRIKVIPGNADDFEGEYAFPSNFYWIGVDQFSISEPYLPNQDIIDNQNQNADKVTNGWQSSDQPNTDSIANLNDVENGISQSTQGGRDNVNNTFSNFSITSNSSVGKGMLAFTNIAKEFLGISGFSDIINFGLVLGLVAFLLGVSATWSGVARSARLQGYKQAKENKGGD